MPEVNPVLINVDECSVKFELSDVYGTISRSEADAGQRTPLNARRGAVTLMACVSNDPMINKRLPQVLIANHHQVSKTLLAAVAADPLLKSSNLQVWREQTAWVTVGVMVKFLELLHSILTSLDCLERKVVLFMDMATPHVATAVRKAAHERQIHPILIPARCTPFFQPLDVSILNVFKSAMREAWVEFKHQSLNPDGSLTRLEWLRLVEQSVRKSISQRDWSNIFFLTGLLGEQLYMSRRLRRQLNWPEGKSAPCTLPTLHQAAFLFPRGRAANAACWLYGDHIEVDETIVPALD